MRTFHMSAPDMNRRGNDFIRSQFVHYKADSGYVCDRVHGPDFMEMDVCYRNTVNMTLGFRDQLIDAQNVVFYLFGKIQMIPDNMLNAVKIIM